MAEDDPDRVDPRYDPAFQRGYAGEVRMGQRGESALRRTTAVSTAPARLAASAPAAPPAEVAAPAPAHVSSSDAAQPSAAEGAPVPAASRLSSAPDPVVAEPASARDATRNPFYLAAAALAVLLIVGGAVWLNQGFAAIADDRTSTTVGYYAAMAMSFGAPLVIGIGVLIIAGLLFVLARGWRPRDEES
jgi:hypothetical protein